MTKKQLEEENRKLRKAISEAALAIPECSGPIAHRIRLLREYYQDIIEKLEKKLDDSN